MASAVLLGRIRGRAAQTLTLRSLSTQVADRHEDQINSISSYVIKSLDDDIKIRRNYVVIPCVANDMIKAIHMSALSRVLDTIQNYPQAEASEVSRLRSVIRSEVSNDFAGATKDEIVSAVYDIVTRHHKVDPSKLMGEGHYDDDLGWSLQLWAYTMNAVGDHFKLRSNIPTQIETCKLLIDYVYEELRSLSSPPSDDQIISLASLLIKIIDEYIKYLPRRLDYDPEADKKMYVPNRALILIVNLHIYRSYPTAAKFKIISTVFDHIENYTHVPKQQVYVIRRYIRSMSIEDGKDDLSRDQVISRVLDYIKNYPIIIDQSKVTKECHFEELMNKVDSGLVLFGLAAEFKLDIPEDIDSCKRAIDYIFDNRVKRLSIEEFDKNIGFSLVSGEYVGSPILTSKNYLVTSVM